MRRRRRRACLLHAATIRLPMSLHPDLLQTALPQWDFWLARVALLQFLASNPPPSSSLLRQQTDGRTRTDGQPVWHLAVTSPRRRRGATTSSPLANVQMTRDESVRDPRPKDGASHECACSWLPSPLHAVCWRPRLRMTQVLSAMPTRFHSHSKFPARPSVGRGRGRVLPSSLAFGECANSGMMPTGFISAARRRRRLTGQRWEISPGFG